MMDVWESLVQEYLCLDRCLFLSTQYEVGDRRWKASHDFLALDFGKRIVWVVEVSSSKSGFADKIANFTNDYTPRINSQLQQVGIATAQWHFGIWLFLSEKYLDWARRLLTTHGIQPNRAMSLEAVARDMLNGAAWRDRRDDLRELTVLESHS